MRHLTSPSRAGANRSRNRRAFGPRFFALAALLGLSFLSTGCVFWAPGLEPMRRDFESRMPGVSLEPEVQVRLGRLSMAITRSIARHAADEDLDEEERAALELLRHIRKTEVAVYEVEKLGASGLAAWNDYVRELGERRGWTPLTRVSDADGQAAVFLREKRGRIRSIHVFTADEDSLVMARLSGRMDEVLAEAIALGSLELTREMAEDGDADRDGDDREPEARQTAAVASPAADLAADPAPGTSAPGDASDAP